MIIVIARVRPRPDRLDELRALLGEVEAASRLDDGCLHYGYFASITDPACFIAVEQWRDMPALEAHLREPHVAKLIAALPEMLQALPEIEAHDVSASGPLPLPR